MALQSTLKTLNTQSMKEMVSHVVSQFKALFNLHKNKQFKSHPESTVVTIYLIYKSRSGEWNQNQRRSLHESEVFSRCTQE